MCERAVTAEAPALRGSVEGLPGALSGGPRDDETKEPRRRYQPLRSYPPPPQREGAPAYNTQPRERDKTRGNCVASGGAGFIKLTHIFTYGRENIVVSFMRGETAAQRTYSLCDAGGKRGEGVSLSITLLLFTKNIFK